MEIIESEDGEVTVIEISGRLWGEPEGESLSETLSDLKGKGCSKIVIDMEGISLMNSSGLGSLIAGMKSFREIGGDMKLANANERIQTILKITKLNQVFKTYDNRDEAISSFS